MRRNAFLWITWLFFPISSHAQFTTEGFDSVAMDKPEEAVLHYVIHDPALHSADFEAGRIMYEQQDEKGMKRNAWRRFFIPCRINFSDQESWQVQLFGKWQKIRSFEFGKGNVDNSDFRIVPDINTTWTKGAWGFVYDNRDTVGRFTVSTDLLNDASYQRWLTPLFVEQYKLPADEKTNRYDEMHRTFGLSGEFSGRKLYMVYLAQARKGWIYYDTTMVAMWRSDNDHMNITQKAKTSKRWPPYLLTRPGITAEEQLQLLRIAFVGRFVAEALKPGQFF